MGTSLMQELWCRYRYGDEQLLPFFLAEQGMDLQGIMESAGFLCLQDTVSQTKFSGTNSLIDPANFAGFLGCSHFVVNYLLIINSLWA